MADININFGTEDLDGLRKLIAELQKAIETLRKGVQETGVITKETTEQAAKYTNAQKAATTEISKRMKAIKAEEGSVLDLTQRYKLLKKEIDATAKPTPAQENQLKRTKAALDAAKKSTNEWGVALQSFQFKFNALGNIAANVLSSITTYAKQFIKDSIQMAAATEGVRNAFNNLNKPGLLDNLRKATRGTVTDLSLMKAAVLAENFKIPLDQLSTFLKFAGNQALRTGQDFDYLVDSIVRGLGRESVLVLDNLGLSAKELQDEAKKTGSFFEGAATVIKREMAAAGDVFDTTATQLARFTATVENLKVQLGNNLAPAIGAGAGAVADFFTKLNELGVSVLSVTNPMRVYEQINRKLILDALQLAQAESGVNDSLEKRLVLIKGISEGSGGEDLATAMQEVVNASMDILKQYGEDQDKETDANLEDRKKGLEKKKELEIKSAKEISDILIELQKETDETFADLNKIGIEKENDTFLINLKNRIDAEIQAEKDKEDAKFAIKEAAINTTYDLINAFSAFNQAAMQKELQQTGLSEAQKEDIKRKYARKDQNIAVGEAIINQALAVTDVWKKWAANPVVAAVLTGLALTSTGLQIAAIKAQKFAKGGEIGGKPHDQGGTIIEAERGEFVVKKSAYQKNKELVNAINAEDSYKIAIAMRQDKGGVKQEKDYNKLVYELLKNQESGYETPEFYVIRKGNVTTRLHKK